MPQTLLVTKYPSLNNVPCRTASIPVIPPLKFRPDDLLNDRLALRGIFEDMPFVSRYPLESFLKSSRLVLRFDTNSGNICYFANENQPNPAGESTIAALNVSQEPS
jgi:hypothetical protein